jgi:hypothetical protein
LEGGRGDVKVKREVKGEEIEIGVEDGLWMFFGFWVLWVIFFN